MREKRIIYTITFEKPQGTRALVRPRFIWDNIKNNVKEIGCEGVDWIHLA
jgi:hypothetical protein